MEVFDYLITNNLFVHDSGKDFLSSRIKIDEYGFVEETQVRRGVWDEEHPNQKRVLLKNCEKEFKKQFRYLFRFLPVKLWGAVRSYQVH